MGPQMEQIGKLELSRGYGYSVSPIGIRRELGRIGVPSMRDADGRSSHPLDEPWPAFLNRIDTDPLGALEALYTFAWKLCQARPPSILRTLDPSEQQDRISDLVVICSRDNFHKLRKYRDVGRPFAGWLATVLDRQVRDFRRQRKPAEELTEGLPAARPESGPGLSTTVLRALGRALDQMSEKCRLYLGCLADGMKPREIAELLQLPDGENTRLSDDLRHCVRRVRELLLAEGVRPEEVAS